MDSGRRTFTVYLEAEDSIPNVVPTSFKGEHCGVFESGRRMDCILEEFSIFLNQKSENTFTGKITSGYSQTDFEIRLTYIAEDKKILWEVTKEGEGLFYFPLKVILE